MTKGRVIRTISVYDESSQHPKSIKRQRGPPSVSSMIEMKSPWYNTLESWFNTLESWYNTLESQVDQIELIEYCVSVVKYIKKSKILLTHKSIVTIEFDAKNHCYCNNSERNGSTWCSHSGMTSLMVMNAILSKQNISSLDVSFPTLI